jgi:hypothetical protein
MYTDMLAVSSRWTRYTFALSAGDYVGIFRFVREGVTETQLKYLNACGEFSLKNEYGTVMLSTFLGLIPLGDPVNYLRVENVIPDSRSRIELVFHDSLISREAVEEGRPLKWSDFPGEIKLGFVFVEAKPKPKPI